MNYPCERRKHDQAEALGNRWFVVQTYVKVSGVWSFVYRAVDQHGQVIDVYVSQRRDIASARMFFTAALAVHGDRPGSSPTGHRLWRT